MTESEDDSSVIRTIDGKPFGPNGEENLHLNLSELKCSPEITPPATERAFTSRDIEVSIYAKNGDVEGFRKEAEKYDRDVIRRELNRNGADDQDHPALHYAVRHGHIEMIRAFFDFDADPDVKNVEGQTALHLAAKYKPSALGGYSKHAASPAVARRAMHRTLRPFQTQMILHQTIISVLLQNGATVDARDNFNYTPLHYAALKDNVKEARELIEKGHADVNANDMHSYSPLHLAAIHGAENVAKLLIFHHARLIDIDDRKNTPLHLASRTGESEVVRIILDKIEEKDRQKYIEQPNSEDNSALHLATNGGHLKVVEEIFQTGVDINVNVARKDKVTLLHLAAGKGSLQLCQTLIGKGANVTAMDAGRKTPLHYAAENNHCQIIELLLENNADIECRDKDGFTPFLSAVSSLTEEAVKTLCGAGCDCSVVDVDQRSAIYLCAKFRGIKILRYLLEDSKENEELVKNYINKSTTDFQTPMHVAAANADMEVLRLLKEKGGEINAAGDDEETPMHLACQEGQIQVVRQLIEWDDSTIHDIDDNGNTPLHYAAKSGELDVVLALIAAGANILARNSYEETALDCATRGGFHDVCVELLDRMDERIAYDSMPNNVTTPLHIAAEAGHENIIQVFIEKDMSIDRVNEQGQTCLDIAIANNNIKCAQEILQSEAWRDVLRVSNGRKKSHKHKLRCTPMCRLIREMPDMARIVFDKCMTRKKDELGHEYIEYDYEFINDTYVMKPPADGSQAKTSEKYPYEEDGTLKDNTVLNDSNYDNVIKTHPLQIMVKSERIDLLKHRLVSNLIRHKWNTYARYIYYTALFIYCMYLMAFTIFVSNTPAPYNLIDINRTWEVTGGVNKEQCEHIDYRRPRWLGFFRVMTMVLAVGQIAKEFYQFCNRRWRYFNIENCFEVCLYVGSFLVCLDLISCSSLTGIRAQWQWMLAGVMIFCAWINLILLIRKIPRFGIYVVMVVNTIKTFYRFSLIFALFIIAFSSGFFVVLQNKPEFAFYLPSFVKTTVMMIGEFEYTAIFYEDADTHASHLFGRNIAHAIFLVFMVVMNVILMNLLVGLAVDDIKGVLEKAELMRLRMQVETILDIERALPDFVRRFKHKGKEILYCVNKKGKLDQAFLLACWKYLGYSRSDVEELEDEYDEYEDTANVVISNQNRNMKGIKKITDVVKEIQSQVAKQDEQLVNLQTSVANIHSLLEMLLQPKTEPELKSELTSDLTSQPKPNPTKEEPKSDQTLKPTLEPEKEKPKTEQSFENVREE
ncbi:hypothetical protein L596_005811 [Steinernema carpocapsae]|uniref:Ion transport domain-containing protein n=1 Tax=Steinernema carpocapsae TaxID=34508 RepID=A0A4U8V627_STECR|nr:hypothetical protein L596_005811 [Steinernema carpocapsae]